MWHHVRMANGGGASELYLVLLEESFVGSDKGGNYYLDTGTGWFPTLAKVSAEAASRSLTPGGTTIAAHVFHTTFYLNVMIDILLGKPEVRIDWRQSWVVSSVEEARWEELRSGLRGAYDELVRLLRSAEAWGEGETEVAMCCITHSAYHLGAVRQFLTVSS